MELIQYSNIHENGLLRTTDDTLIVMKTLEYFLDSSDTRKIKEYGERLKMLPIHEINLDSEYEQTIQIKIGELNVPSISKK